MAQQSGVSSVTLILQGDLMLKKTEESTALQVLEVPEVAKAICALIAKADHAADKAEQYYISAGRHLGTLKNQKPDGVTWEAFVKEHCGITSRRADQLIQIGDGRITLDEVREKNRDNQRRVRARAREVRTSHQPEPEIVTAPEVTPIQSTRCTHCGAPMNWESLVKEAA